MHMHMQEHTHTHTHSHSLKEEEKRKPTLLNQFNLPLPPKKKNNINRAGWEYLMLIASCKVTGNSFWSGREADNTLTNCSVLFKRPFTQQLRS